MIQKRTWGNQFLAISFCFLANLLLNNCSMMSPVTPSAISQQFRSIPFAQRQARLSTITIWQLNGGFSIQQTEQLPVIANFTWHQYANDRYRIDINAPLNVVSAVIMQQPGDVNLQTSQGNFAHASSAELLMQNMLGWSLPISNLNYWIRGIPAPTPGSRLYFDQYGHLITLQQDGWVVRFEQYQNLKPGIDLPYLIELQRPGIKVKIQVKNWSEIS